MAWFNKISPDGKHIVGQKISTAGNEIELDGKVIGRGHAPQWLFPDQVIWAEDGGTGLMTHLIPGEVKCRLEIGRQTNGLQAIGDGYYVAEHRSDPFGYTYQGNFIRSDYTPKLYPQGRLVQESLIWQRTPVVTPSGIWTFEQETWISQSGDTRLVLRYPNNRKKGHIIHVGDTHNPDIVFSGLRFFLIVFTHRGGTTGYKEIGLNDPVVDLTSQGEIPPPPPPENPVLNLTKFQFPLANVDVVRATRDPLYWRRVPQIDKIDAGARDGRVWYDYDQAGQWPIEYPLDDKTQIDATLWIFYPTKSDGSEWIGGPFDWMRPGDVDKDPEKISDIGLHDFQGTIAEKVFKTSHVAIMVSTPARDGYWPFLTVRTPVVIVPVGGGKPVWTEEVPNQPEPDPDPEPEPEPEPEPPPPYPNEQVSIPLFAGDYREAGRNDVDAYQMVWWGRVVYDWLGNGLTFEDSVKKHRNELRSALGLPPLK